MHSSCQPCQALQANLAVITAPRHHTLHSPTEHPQEESAYQYAFSIGTVLVLDDCPGKWLTVVVSRIDMLPQDNPLGCEEAGLAAAGGAGCLLAWWGGIWQS